MMALGLVGRAEAGVLLCLHCPPACCCTCDPWGGLPACLSQSNAPILPIMLATKLLPEMEAEEQALLQQLVEEQRPYAAGAGAAGAPPPLSLAEQFAWLQDQERQLNHLIDQLSREEDSLLGAKGERRKELQLAAAKAAAPAAPAQMPPAVRQQPPAPHQLPRQQQGAEAPDVLLAAITYGAGLA